MILADTMVWADFVSHGDQRLAELLRQGTTVLHPYVRGELSLGNLARRQSTLTDLDALPQAPVATREEVATLIETEALFGAGIGYVDAHLLASTRLLRSGKLWTRDKRLLAVAQRLGIIDDAGGLAH